MHSWLLMGLQEGAKGVSWSWDPDLHKGRCAADSRNVRKAWLEQLQLPGWSARAWAWLMRAVKEPVLYSASNPAASLLRSPHWQRLTGAAATGGMLDLASQGREQKLSGRSLISSIERVKMTETERHKVTLKKLSLSTVRLDQKLVWMCLLTMGSKITVDGDCSHEIKRHLFLGRKAMKNPDSVLKSRDATLPTKVCLVKAMVFPVVMYGCESWTIKKAEHQRIDAFQLWCWRSLLRVLWTVRRSNQLILKEIIPEYSLEGLMLKLKLQYFGHLMWRADTVEKTLMLGKVEGRGRTGWQRMRWRNQHEFEQTLEDSEGQGSLVCCSPWGCKNLDML